jgi:LPXTG-site transpeptidase (sortase) family protein
MNIVFRVLWAHKVAFFATFFFVFTLSYVVLLALDFLPEPPVEEQVEERPSLALTQDAGAEILPENESTVAIETIATPQDSATQGSRVTETPTAFETQEVAPVSTGAMLPVRITIDKIGKTIPVLNPTSRSIADLDAALLEGVVRHPDSATLSQEGNIFILGHSSYLPNVFNRNFQAFNGIQNLEWGDVIRLHTAEYVYEYRVERVYRARAQDVTVPISGTGNMLTLATCNSFGSVDDRYIVEARQKSVQAL